MLDPNYMLHISEPAEDIAEQLHNSIIKRIVERMMIRIGRGEEYLLTATDKWQIENLQEAGYLLEDIQAEIARKTRIQEQEIKEAMEEAGVKSIEYDNSIYESVGLSPKPLKQSPNLIRIMQRNYAATMGEWKNFTRTIAEESQRQFINSCDIAYNHVITGSLSYTEAVKEAINSIVSTGVEVVYPSGHRDTIETATLRCVRTGVSQASAQIGLTRMEEMGIDKVIVSSHLGARPEHQVWQGKIFTKEQLHSTDEGMPAYGTVTGLCGANCRHNFSPYIDGMSNPFEDYSSEENIKMYEKEQRQRLLERRIRETKREVLGLREGIDSCEDEHLRSVLEKQYMRKAALLSKQNQAYNDYCEQNGMKKLYDRISIAKWDRKQAAAAVGAAKRYKKVSVKTTVDNKNNVDYNRTRSRKELQTVAQSVQNEISQYVNNVSKWSGRININNTLIAENTLGRKDWNCDITLVDSADDGVVWHEMLHSCSVSHEDAMTYVSNQCIEEASVEFLKQQICKERGITSVLAYEELTSILQAINSRFKYGTDMEFAKELFNVPLINRYQWLEDKVDDSLRNMGASFSDYNDVMLYIQQLKGVIQ